MVPTPKTGPQPVEVSTKESLSSKKAYQLKRKSKKGGMMQWVNLISIEIGLVYFLYQRMESQQIPFPDWWGLWLGIRGVLYGHVVVFTYHFIRKSYLHGTGSNIQQSEPNFSWSQELIGHATRAEAFFMLVPYLSITWLFKLMPESYYDLEAPVSVLNVFLQFAVYDLITYIIHRVQHQVETVYRTHKDHHAYINPHLFNAYSGSVQDTTLLILIPLYLTVLVLHLVGVDIHQKDYAWFGCTYANYFMLIHSEYSNPWDGIFEAIGIGTARDHNVHHSQLKFNFGHFFMWWDQIFGTYLSHTKIPSYRTYKAA
nr:alternative squalene epoxidase [Bigelowiella natans]AYI99270.1 alternative squalene epoxidase [synthetic construct]